VGFYFYGDNSMENPVDVLTRVCLYFIDTSGYGENAEMQGDPNTAPYVAQYL
jgi:hypothetical protein